MKSLIIAFTLLASVAAKTVSAGEGIATPVVLNSFKTTFNCAKDVSWSESNSLYRAQFELNGSQVVAFYNTDGVMVAVTRNVTLVQLPVTLQTALQKSYPSHWVSELFELSNDDGTHYYITVENADNKVVLKSAGSAGWSTYRKSRKE